MTLPFPSESYDQIYSRVKREEDGNNISSVVMPNPNTYMMSPGNVSQALPSYNPPTQMPLPFRDETTYIAPPNEFIDQSIHSTYAHFESFQPSDPPAYSFPEPSIFPDYRRNTEPSHSGMPVENFGQFQPSPMHFPEPDFSSSFPPSGGFAMHTNIYGTNNSTSVEHTSSDPPRFPMIGNFLTPNTDPKKPEEIPGNLYSNSPNSQQYQGIVPVTDDIYPPLFSGYPPAKPSQISALANLTGAGISNRFEWVDSTNGYIPPEAIGCGKESNGSPLYVSKVFHKQVTHVGMVSPSLKGISFVHKNSVLKQKACYVLCGDIRGLRWVKRMGSFTDNGEKFVKAGVTEAGKAVYIAIVDYRGGIYIGEVSENSDGMCFAYKGKKLMAPDYYHVLAYNF